MRFEWFLACFLLRATHDFYTVLLPFPLEVVFKHDGYELKGFFTLRWVLVLFPYLILMIFFIYLGLGIDE